MNTIYKTIDEACIQLGRSVSQEKDIEMYALERLAEITNDFKDNVKDIFPTDSEVYNITLSEYAIYSMTAIEAIKQMLKLDGVEKQIVAFISSILIITLQEEDKRNMYNLKLVFKRTAVLAKDKLFYSHLIKSGIVHYYSDSKRDIEALEGLLDAHVDTKVVTAN